MQFSGWEEIVKEGRNVPSPLSGASLETSYSLADTMFGLVPAIYFSFALT